MINLILSETSRSLIYLEQIIKYKIKIYRIILYSKKLGKVFKFIKKKKIDNLLIYCKSDNINSQIINQKLESNKKKINIISTYAGEIVNNSSLLKKKLIHCHPGDLPEFKGSTTIYYSMIIKKKICVTVFIMSKKIDEGKILYKKYFNYPKNLKDIENNFDNTIRASALISYLKNNNIVYNSNTKDKILPYYIAHPIIRQLVLKKKNLL